MSTIMVNSDASDDARRKALYDGRIFTFSSRPSALALCEHAWDMISEAFAPLDPMEAQDKLSVEKFVETLAPLKSAFPHSSRSKQILKEMLDDFGCDIAQTYFDVPKLRIVTHSGYLTAGLGYAYKPHRDLWYAAPPNQLNWWMPITKIDVENSLAFHPRSWSEPVPNSSDDFDPYRWNSTGRKDAAKYVTSDSRNHPRPTEDIDLEPQVRIIGAPGSMLIFSANHLHSTVPNTSGQTRYSIDFRTTHIGDLERKIGAPMVDVHATGTTLRDFLRADDQSPIPEELIELYDVGSTHEGELVFQPTNA